MQFFHIIILASIHSLISAKPVENNFSEQKQARSLSPALMDKHQTIGQDSEAAIKRAEFINVICHSEWEHPLREFARSQSVAIGNRKIYVIYIATKQAIQYRK